MTPPHRVHVYEKAWMWGGVAQIAIFIAIILWSAGAQGMFPPSRVETIDPQQVMADPRFATPGVTTADDGTVVVTAVARVFMFMPAEIRVPAHREVAIRITSPDVIHGFAVVGTNVNVMVVPGYVTEARTTFDKPGEYLVVCNEYCGTAHHVMSGKLIVEEAP